jgi:hypothetical protein
MKDFRRKSSTQNRGLDWLKDRGDVRWTVLQLFAELPSPMVMDS